MKNSFKPSRALSVLAMLSLSACSWTPSAVPMALPSLKAEEPECLQTCPPIPEPTGPSEEEVMRWELQLVQWADRCRQINQQCKAAIAP